MANHKYFSWRKRACSCQSNDGNRYFCEIVENKLMIDFFFFPFKGVIKSVDAVNEDKSTILHFFTIDDSVIPENGVVEGDVSFDFSFSSFPHSFE